MADGDLRMIVDCSLPVDDPGHAKLVPLTARERADRDAAVTRLQAEINEEVRSERDSRLASSDWTQARDSPLSEAKIAEWAVYRQALRDMSLVGRTPIFPDPPSR